MNKRKLISMIIEIALLVTIIVLAFVFGITKTIAQSFNFSDLTIGRIVYLLCMVLAMMILGNLISYIIGKVRMKSHRARTVLSLSRSILKYVIAIVTISWGLNIIGVDVASIVASIGILALIIGFGAESLIADVVTGVFMLFENEYNVGDIIEVNGFRGTVTNIGIRMTSIMDTAGNIKIINNAEMKNILNRSNNASKAICDIQIPYETDLEAFEKELPAILETIQKNHADLFAAVPVYLGVQALESSGVTLRFVGEVREKKIFDAQRALNRDLLVLFKKAGVSVPYAQLDIHNK